MATKGRLVPGPIVFLTGIRARIDVDIIVAVPAAGGDGVDVVKILSLNIKLYKSRCEIIVAQ